MQNGGRWVMLFGGLLLGLSFCILIRAGSSHGNVPEDERETMSGQLELAAVREEELAAEVRLLEELLNESLERSDRAGYELLAARDELSRLEMNAGAIALEGPGVSISVRERGFALYAQKVTDVDLLVLINELSAAGAEAVSVNGERIGPLTEIRLAGNYININGGAIRPPYEINAIGDSEVLAGALRLYGGITDSLEAKADITISERRRVEIPAVRELNDMALAIPREEDP